MIEKLTDTLIPPNISPFLMKLALTNINLSDMGLTGAVADLLAAKKHLQYVDLSWTCLGPRHLEMITNVLIDMAGLLRDVNLSYNKFTFHDERSNAWKYSVAALENLKTLLEKARILNHVNFSGMNIELTRLVDLCHSMANSPLLMGIHLNDNEISTRMEYFLEVLDVFDLTLKDVPRRRIDEIDPDYLEQEELPESVLAASRDRVDI